MIPACISIFILIPLVVFKIVTINQFSPLTIAGLSKETLDLKRFVWPHQSPPSLYKALRTTNYFSPLEVVFETETFINKKLSDILEF